MSTTVIHLGHFFFYLSHNNMITTKDGCKMFAVLCRLLWHQVQLAQAGHDSRAGPELR
jgi:hypothetical protein